MRSWVLVVVLVAAACGDDAPNNGDAGVDPDAGVDGEVASCGPGEMRCDDACVSASAPEHCGRCGHACGAGQACDRGTCVGACTNHTLDLTVQSPAGTSPETIALGQFDGDAELDVVVVADFFDNQATVMLGTGTGAFRSQRAYETTAEATGAFTGDVDGDGDGDILVAGTSTIFVMLGNGDGTFVVTPVPGRVRAVGDLNEDGRLDAIDGSSQFQIRYGTATGLAANVTNVAAPGGIGAFAVSDLDGDAHLDLAYTDGSNLVVLKGNGAGGFPTSSSSVTAGGTASRLVLGDFVGDDRLDALVRVGQAWHLQAATGPATFGAPQPIAIRSGGVEVADLDRDGKDDLVIRESALCVQLATAGGFGPARCTGARGTSLSAHAVGDVGNDGMLDVIAAEGGQNGSLSTFRVLPGGVLEAPALATIGAAAGRAVAADLDGNSRVESLLIYANERRVHVVGATVATPIATLTTTGTPVDVAVGNLDGTGALDAVVATTSGLEIAFGALTTGAATLAIAGTDIERVAVGDVTGDGRADLVTLEANRRVLRVYRSTAPGVFETTPASSVDLDGGFELAVGHLDADLLADVALVGTAITIRRGLASGAFEPPTAAPVPSESARRVGLADLDGDGDLDVAIGSGWLALQAGVPAGMFQSFPNRGELVWSGRFDGDALDDLLLQAGRALLLARGTAAGPTVERGWQLDASPAAITAGDADGDGTLDVTFAVAGGVRFLPGTAEGPDLDRLSVAPVGIALSRGDFDEDGRDDVVLLGVTNVAHVLLARGELGQPVFTAAGTLAAASPPHVVDADLDGHLDLVIGAGVFRGDGTGAFAAPIDPPSVAVRTSSLGFLDRDAYPDLLVQSEVVGDTRSWLGGAAGFTAGAELPRSVFACAADLDGDGAGDLVTAELSGQLTTAPGAGDGSFGAPAIVDGISTALVTELVCRDVSADGKPDVLATSATLGTAATLSANGLGVILGGASGLAAPVVHELGAVAARLDTPLLDSGSPRALVTSGSFVAVLDASGALRTSTAVAGPAITGDFDGDAVVDLAIATASGVVVYGGTCE